MEKYFYTIPEAAKICFVARQTMWRWIKSGELKGFPTPGGNYRIRKEDLEYFIQEKMKHLPAADLLQRKKILIVDDDPQILKMLSRMLSGSGFRVEKASGSFEAGVMIIQFEPDLIILDLYMPGIDGFEVCEQIKKNPKTTHIKIIAYTGFDTKENRDRIMKAGADGYMIKPVNKRLLIQNIENLIS
jgi:excisionase family DNA binding protein